MALPNKDRVPSKFWYVGHVFLWIITGLICYLLWKDENKEAARKHLIRSIWLGFLIWFVVVLLIVIVSEFPNTDNPLKVCINDRNTSYKITATLELFVDGNKADLPANIGFSEEGECQRSLYTITDDGTIYAEWEEKYPFELGHFLWIWDFPLSDMDESKSIIFVNGEVADEFIRVPLVDGDNYVARFTSKSSSYHADTIDNAVTPFYPP